MGAIYAVVGRILRNSGNNILYAELIYGLYRGSLIAFAINL
jgi:hypothetical protein